jgi:hypothetical protein
MAGTEGIGAARPGPVTVVVVVVMDGVGGRLSFFVE